MLAGQGGKSKEQMSTKERVIHATIIVPPEANWHPPQPRATQPSPLRPVAVRKKTPWQGFQEWVAGFLVGWGATGLALKHKDAAAVVAGLWLKNKVDREREQDQEPSL